MNIGLSLMVGLSLLPIGLLQAWASVEHGLWFARSADFMQQPLIENLRWLRIIGDTVFLVGVGAFTWFMSGTRLRLELRAAPVRNAAPAGAAPRSI